VEPSSALGVKQNELLGSFLALVLTVSANWDWSGQSKRKVVIASQGVALESKEPVHPSLRIARKAQLSASPIRDIRPCVNASASEQRRGTPEALEIQEGVSYH